MNKELLRAKDAIFKLIGQFHRANRFSDGELYVFKINIVAYIFVGILTILQTIAAFGYCSAQKLYECLVLGKNCCNLGKKLRGGKCNVR